MPNQKMTKRMFGALALLGAVLIWSTGALAEPPLGIQGTVIVDNDDSNPVPVVIQGSNPIPVVIEGSTPTPRIPASLLGGCFFSIGDYLCDSDINEDVVFPEGTNTLEIRMIQARFTKVSESADYDVKFSMNVRFRTPGNFYSYGVSGTHGPAFNGGHDEFFYHSENVLMFAEYVPSGRCELSVVAASNNQSCRVLLTGYFIWVDEDEDE